jgi:hypothetical protein
MTYRKWSFPSVAFAMLGALVWAGCGGGANGGGSYYCDNTGCYQCDGYSCRSVAPPQSSSTSCSGELGCTATDAGTSVLAADSGSSIPATDGGTTLPDAGPACGDGNGPCACTSDTQCAASQVCVAGACTASTNACQFSSQCAPGDVCDDGQCVADCSGSATASSCASGSSCQNGACKPSPVGSTCTSSAQCSGGTPVCLAGHCAPACTTDAQCPTGDYCNQGACEVNTRPTPDCTQQSDCTGGATQQCLGGYCVYTCSTNTQCADIDVRIDVCSATVPDAGPSGYCESPTEATPQCTSQSQCPTGDDCISNVCK